jgi:FkbM family methyltransferase
MAGATSTTSPIRAGGSSQNPVVITLTRLVPRIARIFYRLLRTCTALCRRLGVRDGTAVAAQLLRRGEVVRFPDRGRSYYIKRDSDVAKHIIESTPKLRRLAEIVTPEDRVVIDVGAHSGLFATFAKERNPGALVVAVEPDPSMRSVIEKNLEPHAGWRFLQRAVSDRGGKSSFYRNLDATQTSSLFEDSARAFPGDIERVDVEVTTLDEIVQELAVDRVDVLKLDVQGAERMVLAGADATLSALRKLIVEVTFLDPDPVELLTFLREKFGVPQTLNAVYMGADLLYRRNAAVVPTGGAPAP